MTSAHQRFVLLAVAFLLALTYSHASAQYVRYYAVNHDGFSAGDFVANSLGDSDAAILQLAIGGPDLTTHCRSPYCDGDTAVGVHGVNVTVGLSYDGSKSVWGFDSISIPGIYLFDAVIANRPGITADELNGFTYAYTPGVLPDISGEVLYVVPEPMSCVWLLGVLVWMRR